MANTHIHHYFGGRLKVRESMVNRTGTGEIEVTVRSEDLDQTHFYFTFSPPAALEDLIHGLQVVQQDRERRALEELRGECRAEDGAAEVVG